MTKLFAFGDSFVVGDLDDFGPNDINYNPNFPPTHNMNYEERTSYLKYNVSFASHIARHYNFEFENLALRGFGNFVQLDALLKLASENKLSEGDVILFGITINFRDRLSILEAHRSLHDVQGIIHHSIRKDPRKFDLVEQFDHYWVLSVLQSIKNTYNVKVIAFNLFYNPVFKYKGSLKFNFDFFIGNNIDNNTMVDVLNDTYNSAPLEKHVNHTLIEIPNNCKDLYTWNKHPSELGHLKIKNWLVNYINQNNG